jgi:hypothetical protein
LRVGRIAIDRRLRSGLEHIDHHLRFSPALFALGKSISSVTRLLANPH